MPDTLYIYNSLTRKKEIFKPINPGFVSIYVCGPTVYDHSHVGHAKSYISFDVIVRYLRYIGFKVKYVQNITDVGHLLGDSQEGEDRIAKKARLEKLEPMEVAEYYSRSYFEDMDLLGNIRPDISPRASGHIIEQIDMIGNLIEKGLAYETEGNVYFDVSVASYLEEIQNFFRKFPVLWFTLLFLGFLQYLISILMEITDTYFIDLGLGFLFISSTRGSLLFGMTWNVFLINGIIATFSVLAIISSIIFKESNPIRKGQDPEEE